MTNIQYNKYILDKWLVLIQVLNIRVLTIRVLNIKVSIISIRLLLIYIVLDIPYTYGIRSEILSL